ncbi:hypothetical protein DFH08DRAFT_826348 [Mycena albidolilacea]|uniref:Uncharacterized protein n=1 Tax=Mycena albidolilacea TaxID=1033008 RepID=A0AAD6Z0G9_9AGAR|nr:hypothetical protein DFH08DRAFT_826348 [Mycena albidolilacea]
MPVEHGTWLHSVAELSRHLAHAVLTHGDASGQWTVRIVEFTQYAVLVIMMTPRRTQRSRRTDVHLCGTLWKASWELGGPVGSLQLIYEENSGVTLSPTQFYMQAVLWWQCFLGAGAYVHSVWSKKRDIFILANGTRGNGSGGAMERWRERGFRLWLWLFGLALASENLKPGHSQTVGLAWLWLGLAQAMAFGSDFNETLALALLNPRPSQSQPSQSQKKPKPSQKAMAFWTEAKAGKSLAMFGSLAPRLLETSTEFEFGRAGVGVGGRALWYGVPCARLAPKQYTSARHFLQVFIENSVVALEDQHLLDQNVRHLGPISAEKAFGEIIPIYLRIPLEMRPKFSLLALNFIGIIISFRKARSA